MIGYFFVTLLLFTLECLFLGLAGRLKIMNRACRRTGRNSADRDCVTIRGGGFIFVASVWLWAVLCDFSYPWFLIGMTLVSMVSFSDDFRPVPIWTRLIVQFVSVLMMFYELGIIQYYPWWIILIVWLVCVGVVNAYNFMDGINGITGGYSLAVLFPLMVLNGDFCQGTLEHDSFINPDLLRIVLIGVLVFCFFNFRTKARCFSGDVGSIGMAFILIFALGRLIIQTGDWSYIMFLSVYGVDTVLTIIHRIILHETLWLPHRKHAYQLMTNELGFPHLMVASLYMGLQLLISAGLIFLPVNHYAYSAIVLTTLVSTYVIFMKKYYYLHAKTESD